MASRPTVPAHVETDPEAMNQMMATLTDAVEPEHDPARCVYISSTGDVTKPESVGGDWTAT